MPKMPFNRSQDIVDALPQGASTLALLVGGFPQGSWVRPTPSFASGSIGRWAGLGVTDAV